MKEDNQAVIKALNIYGRVPEMWELLEEIERLNNIINGITKVIKHDYFKAREFKEKIQRSELCQGDYPIAYYHADWLEDTTDEYLNKLQELKGSDKE